MSSELATNLAIEFVQLKKSQALRQNARKHTHRQVQRIADSIREFGFTNPLLIDEANEIIAGHGRLEAERLLRLQQVPVIRIVHLNDAQKRSLRLADNRIAETSTWTPELLCSELQFLIDADFAIELTGFDPIDIDRLLTPASTAAAIDDEPIPMPPAWSISRPGDIWQLGDHRIACGVALEPTIYDALLEGRLADLAVTDPPYNVPIPGNVSGTSRHGNFAMASGEMSGPEFEVFLTAALRQARNRSREGSLHYVFMDWRGIARLLAAGKEVYGTLINLCVWAKTNAGMGSFYRSQHELIAVFRHGGKGHINNVQLGRMGRHRSNLWQYPGATTFSPARDADLADHPTVKPVAMIADAIRDASKPGDLVLDPFGGSGATILAAQSTGRRAAVVEIEQRYVDVTLTRFQTMAGIEPLLLPDRIPLTAVRASRLGNGGHNVG